jgi:hypothetical protein
VLAAEGRAAEARAEAQIAASLNSAPDNTIGGASIARR